MSLSGCVRHYSLHITRYRRSLSITLRFIQGRGVLYPITLHPFSKETHYITLCNAITHPHLLPKYSRRCVPRDVYSELAPAAPALVGGDGVALRPSLEDLRSIFRSNDRLNFKEVVYVYTLLTSLHFSCHLEMHYICLTHRYITDFLTKVHYITFSLAAGEIKYITLERTKVDCCCFLQRYLLSFRKVFLKFWSFSTKFFVVSFWWNFEKKLCWKTLKLQSFLQET